MSRKWIFAFLLLGTPYANGTITIESVTGVSATSNLEVDATGTPVIAGGMAGTCTGGSDSTCDSCVAPSGVIDDSRFLQCNSARIHSSLYLRIKFKSDTTGGRPTITDSTGSNPLSFDASQSTASVGQGEVGTVSILWSTICTDMAAGACDTEPTTPTKTFKIGISKNLDTILSDTGDDHKSISILLKKDILPSGSVSTTSSISPDCSAVATTDGVCGFSVVPGDGKVFIQQVRAGDGFPSGVSVQYKKVRMYYEPGTVAGADCSFSSINLGSPHQDLSVSALTSGTATLTPNKVTG